METTKAIETTEFMTVNLDDTHRIQRLSWLPATEKMDTAGFQRDMLRFAELAEQHKPVGLLVDVRAFHHKPAAETGPWRREQIVPRYNRGGVRRFAFLLPEGASTPAIEPAAPDGGPAYETRWFTNEPMAVNWLLTGFGIHVTVEYRLRDDVDLDDTRRRIAEFIRAVREGHASIEYTSTSALDEERAFTHVIRVVDGAALAALQAAPFFKSFSEMLASRCVEPPRVRRRRVVAA
jgi:hypothetical protein